MTGRQIITRLSQNRYRESFAVPNYTPSKWWECDLFEVTKSGYFREFEVKISRSDFFHDATKEREARPDDWKWGEKYPMEKKHDLLARGDKRGPSAFYYVTPEGLLKPEEIPVWAGLIEVYLGGEPQAIYERTITPAPRLHKQKVDQAVLDHAKSVCYWRMHHLLNERIAA